jgi:recombination protein RecT
VIAVKAGEMKHYDPLNEEIEIEMIQDDEVRENTETVGYYAMFEYLNGFRKTMYWSKKKMQKHAEKYSKGYANDIQRKTDWTFWSKDFDSMAFKTMIRQIISKWGIMSIEMQTAIEKDQEEPQIEPDYTAETLEVKPEEDFFEKKTEQNGENKNV